MKFKHFRKTDMKIAGKTVRPKSAAAHCLSAPFLSDPDRKALFSEMDAEELKEIARLLNGLSSHEFNCLAESVLGYNKSFATGKTFYILRESRIEMRESRLENCAEHNFRYEKFRTV